MRPVMASATPPKSVWDMEWESLTGKKLPEGNHYVPLMGLLTAEQLYDLDRSKRGQPLRFTLAEARAIKQAYWSGHNTIAGLAREWHATAVTIGRIVHGETYWYA